ncbi:S-layer protein [Paenibacillus selenitireducens]|uniref:S-layer protein n=1 Tax=Paenibacillus selenitireducens TaxID=1324314 RepID=A0A1T2X2P8_9BACL|nr:S-layer homology domain-containing protein [Paenibacillus selenitireducens]OPA74144.1 S-layer protein [Paenibacillus selenitireducens]
MKRLLVLGAALLVSATLFVTQVQAAEGVIFKDTENHWAKTTIEWGVEKGIVKGYANGMFMPNQNVTEAEFIRMLYVGITGKDLEDQFISDHWSDKYYNHLYFKNYPLNGYADVKQRSTYATRAHIAELVSSADGVNYSGNQAIQYLLGKKYATGRVKGENTIQGFMGGYTITRAEALQLIRNLMDHGMQELYDRPQEASAEAKLPKLPTAWDSYRDQMYITIRKQVFPKYTGYRIYDDGNSKIILSKTLQQADTDTAVAVQFEQQIMSFSGVSLSNAADITQRNMMLDILNLYGFKVDAAFLKKVDEAEKNKKEISVTVSNKTLVIDPQITSPAGNATVYYKWWK